MEIDSYLDGKCKCYIPFFFIDDQRNFLYLTIL